jgi:hypothetical protein
MFIVAEPSPLPQQRQQLEALGDTHTASLSPARLGCLQQRQELLCWSHRASCRNSAAPAQCTRQRPAATSLAGTLLPGFSRNRALVLDSLHRFINTAVLRFKAVCMEMSSKVRRRGAAGSRGHASWPLRPGRPLGHSTALARHPESRRVLLHPATSCAAVLWPTWPPT